MVAFQVLELGGVLSQLYENFFGFLWICISNTYVVFSTFM